MPRAEPEAQRQTRIARSARVQGACSLPDPKGRAFGGVRGNAPGRSGRQPGRIRAAARARREGMKFYLISDNVDTMMGMHLAGINGVVVHEEKEVREALTKAMEMEDVAVILMTERLVQLCPELVYDLKLNRKQPLIVEIPDRHGSGRAKDSITRYVREAIGVKI